MSTRSVRSALRSFLQANWTATPLVFPNQMLPDNAEGQPWVMVRHRGRQYDQASIGAGSRASNLWEEDGTVYLHVFVPSGTGDDAASQYAEDLALLFRTQGELPAAGIRFCTMSIGDGEIEEEDGRWWATTVTVDWRRQS